MTPERFKDLAQAYGADFKRWPEAERVEAVALLDAGGAGTREAHDEAAALDRLLGRHRVAGATPGLAERIIATAPLAPVWRRARLLWQGAGLAGIGLAGALAGALAVAMLPMPPIHDQDDDGAYSVTAFGDLSDEGDVQ
jgi:hypothetical protein